MDANNEGATVSEKRVAVLLGQGFEDSEAVAALDIFRWCEYRAEFAPIKVDVFGFAPKVCGRFGTIIASDVCFDVSGDCCEYDPALYDGVVVSGGFSSCGWTELSCSVVYDFLQRAYAAGAIVATLCVGSHIVAEAGLLRGGRATTYEFSANRDNFAHLEAYGCQAVHEPIIEWERIISCSGPHYSEPIMYKLLERLTCVQNADEIRRYRRGSGCVV